MQSQVEVCSNSALAALLVKFLPKRELSASSCKHTLVAVDACVHLALISVPLKRRCPSILLDEKGRGGKEANCVPPVHLSNQDGEGGGIPPLCGQPRWQ